MTPLLAAIRAHAEQRPDHIAIDGDDPVTWQELARFIPTLATDLTAAFKCGRPVATRLDHGVGETLLDLALADTWLPTIALPPFFTPAQNARALERAGATATIAGRVTLVRGACPRLEMTIDETPRACATLPNDTARITFTSGSTGDPKGICLSLDHMILVASAVVDTLGVHHAGRHMPLLPPGILLENVAGLYATMLAGGTYVALPQAAVGMADPFRPDFLAMLRAIDAHAITSLILVPEYLRGLVGTMQANGMRLPRLTLVAVGGARIDAALLDAAAAVGLPVLQGYGLTECASVVALDDGDPASRGSVGRSIGANGIALADDGEMDAAVTKQAIGTPARC